MLSYGLPPQHWEYYFYREKICLAWTRTKYLWFECHYFTTKPTTTKILFFFFRQSTKFFGTVTEIWAFNPFSFTHSFTASLSFSLLLSLSSSIFIDFERRVSKDRRKLNPELLKMIDSDQSPSISHRFSFISLHSKKKLFWCNWRMCSVPFSTSFFHK